MFRLTNQNPVLQRAYMLSLTKRKKRSKPQYNKLTWILDFLDDYFEFGKNSMSLCWHFPLCEQKGQAYKVVALVNPKHLREDSRQPFKRPFIQCCYSRTIVIVLHCIS